MNKIKKTIRLEIAPGAYDNEDAYELVLRYLYNKTLVGNNPAPTLNLNEAITSFRYNRDASAFHSDRNIWHFYITFSDRFSKKALYSLGNQIASYFVYHSYQTVFAVDTDKFSGANPHLHFAVNNYSMDPNRNVLDNSAMYQHIKNIASYLHCYYPAYRTVIQDHGIRC